MAIAPTENITAIASKPGELLGLEVELDTIELDTTELDTICVDEVVVEAGELTESNPKEALGKDARLTPTDGSQEIKLPWLKVKYIWLYELSS